MNQFILSIEAIVKKAREEVNELLSFNDIEAIIDLARRGCYPVPPEEDWPEAADRLRMIFETKDGQQPTQTIWIVAERQKPRWEPEPKEVVFALVNGCVIPAPVVTVDRATPNGRLRGVSAMVSGSIRAIPIYLIKKYDPEKLGYGWEEI
jgi:hypothetical protein